MFRLPRTDHARTELPLQASAAGYRFMTLVTRLHVAAILSSVILAAQVPSEPTTPAPRVVSEETADGEPTEDVRTVGAVPEDDESTTQSQAGAGNQQSSPANQQLTPKGGVSAGLVTVFTGLLAIVAILQVCLAKRMFYSTHRPKLRVRNVVIPELVNRFGEDSHSSEQGMWACDVVNVGGTPATITFCNVHLTAMNRALIEKPLYSTTENQVEEKIEIAGGEAHRMIIPYTVFTDQDWASIRIHGKDRGLSDATDLYAYVVGVLKYKDKIGLERRTAICRKFDRKSLRFIVEPDPDYEYED